MDNIIKKLYRSRMVLIPKDILRTWFGRAVGYTVYTAYDLEVDMLVISKDPIEWEYRHILPNKKELLVQGNSHFLSIPRIILNAWGQYTKVNSVNLTIDHDKLIITPNRG